MGFNATDYEAACVDYFRNGEFEMARLAIARGKAMRAEGDSSREPTLDRTSATELETYASEFEQEGNHSLAAQARERAAHVRLLYGDDSVTCEKAFKI